MPDQVIIPQKSVAVENLAAEIKAPVTQEASPTSTTIAAPELKVEVAPIIKAEEPAKTEINFNDFLGEAGLPKQEEPRGEVKKDDKTSIIPLEAPTKKTEVSTASITAKPETTTQVSTEPEAADAGTRDYTGLEENEIPLAKRMSNAAFNYVKPALVELKEKRVKLKSIETENASLRQGKVTLPEDYYRHPDAYVLTPEFGELSRNVNLATAFQNHWNEQMIKIEEGKDWQDLVRGADGQYSLSAPIASSPTAKVQVMSYLNHATNQIGVQQGRIQALQQSHVGKYSSEENIIKGASKEYFGYLDDAKHPAHAMYQDVLKRFPASRQKDAVTDLAARAVTAALQYQNAYNILKASNGETTKIAEVVKETVKKVGPTNAAINSGGKSDTKVAAPSFSDFLDVVS